MKNWLNLAACNWLARSTYARPAPEDNNGILAGQKKFMDSAVWNDYDKLIKDIDGYVYLKKTTKFTTNGNVASDEYLKNYRDLWESRKDNNMDYVFSLF